MRCRVTTPGRLGSRRHINLPGVDVNLPSLTEKDAPDIRAGVEAGCDFFALSFVRRAEDILMLRALLDHWARRRGSSPRSKTERPAEPGGDRQGSRRRHGGRGDLGIEIDYHTLPLVQTRIVDLCLDEASR